MVILILSLHISGDNIVSIEYSFCVFYAYLYKINEDVVYVSSFWQEKTTTWRELVEEKQLLILQNRQYINNFDDMHQSFSS